MHKRSGSSSSLARHDENFCDYFLSHKKHHSELGGIPEQIAKNMHDALEMLGHIGFFDVDDLDAISKDNLERCIGQCLTMIVFMNNETLKSEWCTFEWEVAQRMGIPIRVVVDVSHCVKKEIVESIQESPYSFLLQYQWLEYSDSARRSVIQQLSKWISQETGRSVKRQGSEVSKPLFTPSGMLCIKDGNHTLPLFHPLFEGFMVFCGLVYNKEAWSWPVLQWVRVVRFMSVACFGICFWRLVYATGPSYTDWYSCLYVTMIHVFLYHGLVRTTTMLTSKLMEDILRHIGNSALLAWTTRRVNVISKWAAVVGISCGCTAAITMNVIYLPLFLSEEYMSTQHGMAFGISSTIAFLSVAPLVLVQEFAVLTLMFITLVLLRDCFECPLCYLHELIPCVGLEIFVENGCTNLVPTETQIALFSEGWDKALTFRIGLHKILNQVLCVHFACNLGGVMIPFVYLAYGENFLQAGETWQKWAKPFFWWIFACVCFTATLVLPTLANHALLNLTDSGRCLSMPVKHKQFLMTMFQVDLNWKMGPVTITALGCTLLSVPLWASGICWIFVGSMVI